MYGTSATDVVAYAFEADLLCPGCIRRIAAFKSEANGQAADRVSLPTLLDRWRALLGYGEDEDIDTGEFPSPVFGSEVDADHNHCSGCGDTFTG